MAASHTTEAASGGKRIHFSQNTKLMYEKMLSKTPWFVRENARKTMDAAIAEICGGDMIVRENDMYEIVKRTTPKLFIQKSFDIIEEYKTV